MSPKKSNWLRIYAGKYLFTIGTSTTYRFKIEKYPRHSPAWALSGPEVTGLEWFPTVNAAKERASHIMREAQEKWDAGHATKA